MRPRTENKVHHPEEFPETTDQKTDDDATTEFEVMGATRPCKRIQGARLREATKENYAVFPYYIGS